MKLCIHCAHWRANKGSTASNNLDTCTREQPPPVISLVTGEQVPAERVYAELERREYNRNSPNHCGPDGRFWKPREASDGNPF